MGNRHGRARSRWTDRAERDLSGQSHSQLTHMLAAMCSSHSSMAQCTPVIDTECVHGNPVPVTSENCQDMCSPPFNTRSPNTKVLRMLCITSSATANAMCHG